MKIHVQHTFHASKEELLDALVSSAYLDDVCARVSAVSTASVEENERDDQSWRTTVRWVAPTRLPSVLKKYENKAPREVSWAEETAWDVRTWTANFNVAPDVPAHWESKYDSTGTLHLEDVEEGKVRLSQTIEFRLNIGLVGKAIERLLKTEVETLLQRRLEILAAHL